MDNQMSHLSKAQVKWVRSLQQKKVRDAEQVFVAEGEKCISELMPYFELVLHATPDNASDLELTQMSSLRTPQGTLAVFRRPKEKNVSASGLVLALDGVQDPGNVGTILRTCDWFGVRHVFCSRETADCYSPKVVQATMGALARVHVHYIDSLPHWLKNYREQGEVYGTLLEGKNIYLPHAIPNRSQGVIVMGNEGRGLTEEVRQKVTCPLFIPPYENLCVESLNVSVATAIVLAEFRRQ